MDKTLWIIQSLLTSENRYKIYLLRLFEKIKKQNVNFKCTSKEQKCSCYILRYEKSTENSKSMNNPKSHWKFNILIILLPILSTNICYPWWALFIYYRKEIYFMSVADTWVYWGNDTQGVDQNPPDNESVALKNEVNQSKTKISSDSFPPCLAPGAPTTTSPLPSICLPLPSFCPHLGSLFLFHSSLPQTFDLSFVSIQAYISECGRPGLCVFVHDCFRSTNSHKILTLSHTLKRTLLNMQIQKGKQTF